MIESQTLAGALIAGIAALFGVLVWVFKSAAPALLTQYRADVREERTIFQAELAKRDAVLKDITAELRIAVEDNTKATKVLADRINETIREHGRA